MTNNLKILEISENKGYLTWPLPSKRDNEISELIESLVESHTSWTEAGITKDHSKVLSVFAERMSILAVRNKYPTNLHKGLLALGMAYYNSDDWRDVLLIFPLLWRSAEILNLDPTAEFIEAAKSLKLPSENILIDFCERNPKDRTIQSMGYIETENDQGFLFKRAW